MSTNSVPTSPYMTAAEVAAYLRVSLRTVYALAERGDVPSIRVGGQLRVSRNALGKRFGEAAP